MRKKRGWKVWVEASGDSWRCRWTGIFGTGQAIFPYKDDARELAITKRRDFQRLAAGLPAIVKPSSALTISAWAEKYLEDSKREKSPRTFRNFDKPAIESFRKMFPGIALAAITEAQVKDWKYALQEERGATTAAMYFRQVCAFLNAAVRAGHIQSSPARYVRKPPKGGSGRAIRDEELEALMSVAPEALYRTGTFSLNTMCRINEVVIFDWSWVWELPSGGWIGKLPANVRKTRAKVKEDCWFPINAEARQVMGPRKTSGIVFPWTVTTLQHQMIKARRGAKLPEDISFHSFRHTGVSRYLRLGGHIEDLLRSHIWEDPRSLLGYVTLDPQTLYNRFEAMKNPYGAPKIEKPPTRVVSRRLR